MEFHIKEKYSKFWFGPGYSHLYRIVFCDEIVVHTSQMIIQHCVRIYSIALWSIKCRSYSTFKRKVLHKWELFRFFSQRIGERPWGRQVYQPCSYNKTQWTAQVLMHKKANQIIIAWTEEVSRRDFKHSTYPPIYASKWHIFDDSITALFTAEHNSLQQSSNP